jgi:cytidylate kinase
MIPHITIDGPTASGKGTVAQGVANALAWHYLDSGAIYRACALHAMDEDVPLSDHARVAALAQQLPLRFEKSRVFLKHDDVTRAIRAEAIGNAASQISAVADVRAALLQRQRDFLRVPGLVADGRDMGTVVFITAPLKIFLTASAHARARRRFNQLVERGESPDLQTIENDLRERDQRDAQRAVAPLAAAADARTLDTSELTAAQTIAQILQWWNER